MLTVDYAVKHRFTFRDDGKLVRVEVPPITPEGGWQRLLDESDAAPEPFKVIKPWDSST